MSNTEVIGLGALNIDHLYKVERILDDGETVVKEAQSSPGGSAANTIYGLAKLGVNTGFTGVVGDDADGKIMVQDFQKVGVDTGQIRVKRGTKTGSVLCLSDKLGRRSLYVMPGANSLLSSEDIDLGYLSQARLLHLSSFVDEQQFEMQKRLLRDLPSSVKVSFAPGNLLTARGLSCLAPLISRTHILFLNRDEIRQLTGADFPSGAQECLSQGCQIVVVTLGKGIVAPDGRRLSYYIATQQVKYEVEKQEEPGLPTAETTGAGDAFAAGFLYGFVKGKNLQKCGVLGDVVAHFCLSKPGARAGLPSTTELSRKCREYYGWSP